MKTDFGNGQHTTTGQDSYSMLSSSDQVQYSADNDSRASMYYHHIDIDNDNYITKSDWCYVSVSNRKSGIDIAVQYHYELEKRSDGGKSYEYYLVFGAKPGELDKVFESKEAFKDCVDINMISLMLHRTVRLWARALARMPEIPKQRSLPCWASMAQRRDLQMNPTASG